MLGGPDILWGGVVPTLLAGATLAAIWRLTGRAASAWRTALFVGYVAGHWTLSARDLGATALMRAGQLEQAGASWAYNPLNFDFLAAIAKSYQPTEAHDWLPIFALLATVPDAIACVSRFGPLVGWILRVALCTSLPWRLVYGSKYWPLSLGPGFDFDMGGWTTGQATAWIVGIGVALVVAWQLVRLACSDVESDSCVMRSVLATIVSAGSSITLIASGSLLYGQLLGVLSAALIGCGLAAKLAGTKRGPDAAAGPMIIAFGTLLAAGHFYAELSLAHAALLLCAMAFAVGWLPVPTSLSSRWKAACRGLVCLALLALPVISAGIDLTAQIPDSESGIESEPEINPYESFSR